VIVADGLNITKNSNTQAVDFPPSSQGSFRVSTHKSKRHFFQKKKVAAVIGNHL
jgi:hypothetical protein